MAKLLKLRRGSTSQHSSFTGAEGEVTVDTDKDVLVVHDGSTAGGHPLAAQDMDNVPAGSILGTQLENSGVTAGQYGSSSAIPIVTVDAQGLVTAASTTAIDQTTIANGTSNVAVANNGNITATRSGTARLVVNNTGAAVTGDFTAATVNTTGALGCNGDLSVVSAAPTINLTDTNNNPDWKIHNDNGTFRITDTTNNSTKLRIDGSSFLVPMNLDANGGLDVSGAITATGSITTTSTGQYPLNINGSHNGKIVLQGSSEPYIRFREGTTDKGYLQWNANGYFQLVNEETGDYLKVGNSSDGLQWNHDGTNSKVWHSGNDGAGSGLDADTLDGIQMTNFVRSDQSDTMSGQLTLATSTNQKLILQGSSDPYIHFKEGTTDKAYIQWHSNGNLYFVNQESGEQLLIGSGSTGLKFVEGGSTKTVWTSGNDGASSGLDADLLDGKHDTSFLRSDAGGGGGSYNATADLTFSGGAGAISVASGSDIRFATGGWTGEYAGKITHHANYLYFQGGTSGFLFRSSGGSDRMKIDSNGHVLPTVNNTYNLGSGSLRWKNIYTGDLNLSNEGSSNDVDGTWGNYTMQEGENDLYLINRRSGKKYKFNLTEVS